MKHKLSTFRHSLAYTEALPQLTLLGLIIGLATGGIIAIFRLIIELPLSQFLTSTPEDFESLSPLIRVSFIFIGVSLLIALMYSVKKSYRETGVSYVLDRLHNHQGHMSNTNWLVQLLGAAISIMSGQSVGREGPAVHLGAGAASQIGKLLHLPNNNMNTLIGCGVASAIATSFNTPLAGVVFAMEVILKEYTFVGFIPVILAAVMGTMLSQATFANGGDLQFGDTEIATLMELPYMVVIGFIISILASSYTRLNLIALSFNYLPLYARLLLAGTIASIAVYFTPEIMGLGYDTMNQAAHGELLISSLVVIALVKLLVTPVITGLGIPGGLIGPSLMIGACAGAIFGAILESFFPNLGANSSFYVLMGMAGMMAAVLNAPQPALVAVLELSYNPNTIFPAMLVIVVACISKRQLFNLRGIFIEQLKANNKDLDFGPAKLALRRAGIRSVMNTHFVEIQRHIAIAKMVNILSRKPEWCIFSTDKAFFAIRAADIAHYIESEIIYSDKINTEQPEDIDLLAIPGRRYLLAGLNESANLLEALTVFKKHKIRVLYITNIKPSKVNKILGIVTIDDIENFYQPKELRNVMG